MTFGGQTVTFVAVAESGDPGYLGLKTKDRSEVAVAGCRFSPASSSETPDGVTNVATAIWKCTAPPDDAALAAQPGGELRVDGVTYQIDGPIQPKYDMAGKVHHVTIMCKRQTG